MSNLSLSLKDLPPSPQHRTGWPWTDYKHPLPVYETNQAYPKISIVTPSYNYGKFLEETIRSVLLQGYPNLEYIILDGGSTDNTVEIIQKYEQYLTFWESKPDKGQTDAINRGHQLCTGEIFAWLNADDSYAIPTCLQQVADLYLQGYQFIVGECTRLFIDSDQNVLETELKTSNPVNFYQYLQFWNTLSLPQPSVFIDRKITQQCFPLDQNLYGLMDYQFFLRSLSYNPKSIWIKQSWVNYLKHGQNKTMGNTNLGNLKTGDDYHSGLQEFFQITFTEASRLPWLLKLNIQSQVKDYILLFPFIQREVELKFLNIIGLLFQRITLIFWPIFWKILSKSLLGDNLYSNLKNQLKSFKS